MQGLGGLLREGPGVGASVHWLQEIFTENNTSEISVGHNKVAI